MDKGMMDIVDSLTNSLDLLVKTQRSTQEFMTTQLDVNKMLIDRITRLEAKTNVIKTEEPSGVNDIFDNMINRLRREGDNAEKS